MTGVAVGPEYTQLLRDGSQVKFSPTDFAIDYYGRVLYWTDSKFGAILAVGIDRPPTDRTRSFESDSLASSDSHSSPPAAHDTRAGRDSERNDEPAADGRQQQHSRTADDEDYDTQNEADGTGVERDNEGEAREGEPTEGSPVEDIVPRRARPNHYPMPHVSLIYKSKEKDIEPQLVELSLATGY